MPPHPWTLPSSTLTESGPLSWWRKAFSGYPWREREAFERLDRAAARTDFDSVATIQRDLWAPLRSDAAIDSLIEEMLRLRGCSSFGC